MRKQTRIRFEYTYTSNGPMWQHIRSVTSPSGRTHIYHTFDHHHGGSLRFMLMPTREIFDYA